MEATYNEVRLVNAMTALENLSSNTRDSRQLLDDTLFAKLKSALTRTIKDFAEKNDFQTIHPTLADEMTAKLAELQRRSLRRKLDILLERWSVPMEGVTKAMIHSAFSDAIGFRGRYISHLGGYRQISFPPHAG